MLLGGLIFMTKFLITQNQDEMINMSSVTSIRTNGNSIVADVLYSTKEIGQYDSQGEAEIEFNRIMSNMINGMETIVMN
jgi:hypothetical protein